MPTFAPKQNKSTPKAKSLGLPDVHEALRPSGKPLDRVTREHVESRFGHDFSRVRVHTNSSAGDAAAGIHARAFTVNHDIVFGVGEYAPHTGSGLRLLAHELTHVVQQRAGVHLRDGLGQASDVYEQHADAVAALVVQGKPAASLLRPAVGTGQAALRSPGALQKQEDPGKGKPPTTYSGLGLLPVTFKELDANPARGAMQRAQMLAQRHAVGKKPHSADEGWPALFKALLDALERVDKNLTSDAPQSWGLHLWGEGTSSAGSTAAKPAKDVVYLSSTGIDLTEVFEIMDVLVLSVSTKKEMFTTPEDFKENPVEYIFDLKQKVDAIEKARDEEEKGRRAEESRERSAQESQLLQKSQELKKLVKVALDEIKAAEGKVPSIEKKTTTAGKPAGQAPREAKTTSPKTAKPAYYDRDPMGYWNSYPLVALFEGISGNPDSTGGAVAIITDKQGTKRVFRYWFDKNGYQRSEFLKKAPTP
jgi:uncharacterized protein DUF4157